MPLPPIQDFTSPQADLPDVNEEVAAAREALLRFAAAEGVLDSLVESVPGVEGGYPDVEAVRARATVDELMQAVARLPETDEERQGYEATALYASLLQLAEAFDILIDQYSLVYGDAVALAEAMQGAWHALAGCSEDLDPNRAARDRGRMGQNAAEAAPLLARVERLSDEQLRRAVARFEETRNEPWLREARRLALRSTDSCLPEGLRDSALLRALEPARRHATTTAVAAEDPFTLALADLLLARLSEGIAHPAISQVLTRPFEGMIAG